MQPRRLPCGSGPGWGKLGWLPEDLDAFVPVEAGEFLYGDPPKKRTIAQRYWIARYPVTNAQYARFMADGGYDETKPGGATRGGPGAKARTPIWS